jgi:hypothetical protein
MPQPRAVVPDLGGINPGLNNTVAVIPKYRIVKKSTGTDSITPAVDGAEAYVGVTMAAIPIGYAGDVQHKGRALVEAGAAVAIGAKIMAGAGGKGVTATAAKYAIGVANSTALVDTDIIEVDLDFQTLPA